jgi:hypothetical protein
VLYGRESSVGTDVDFNWSNVPGDIPNPSNRFETVTVITKTIKQTMQTDVFILMNNNKIIILSF